MYWGRKCAAPIELPDAGPGDVPKDASLGLGGGVNTFFCIVSCWQSVKFCECFLKLRSFQCIGGKSVPRAMSCPDAGPGDAPKGVSPNLGGGVNAFFSVVSMLGGFENPVKDGLNCAIFNALGAAHCMHFSVLFLDCSVWENALHGCKSGCNAV